MAAELSATDQGSGIIHQSITRLSISVSEQADSGSNSRGVKNFQGLEEPGAEFSDFYLTPAFHGTHPV